MFCKICGNTVTTDMQFCPSCGAKVEQDNYVDYSSHSTAPLHVDTKLRNTTLTLGILAVIFVSLNYLGVYFVHIVGLVLGIVALSYVKKDKQFTGTHSIPGQILAIIAIAMAIAAMLIGIIATVGSM